MQVFVSIGNSDNKLTQQEWSRFCGDLQFELISVSTEIYGWWYSLPHEPFQNMTGSVEMRAGAEPELLRELSKLAERYGQDSIAYSPTTTQFVTPPEPVPPAAVEGYQLAGNPFDQNGGAV